MQPTTPINTFLDFLKELFGRFGCNIPEPTKRLILDSFMHPITTSTGMEIIESLISALGPPYRIQTDILFPRKDGSTVTLTSLVLCDENWSNPKLVYSDQLGTDTIQMLLESFWIFEGLEEMPELTAAKEALRDWKEAVLHELLGLMTKSRKKNKNGLEMVLPLVDDLLKADRECPSYGLMQRTDPARYSRRSYIVGWIYDIAIKEAADIPILSTNKAKMKFKAILAFLVHLDKEHVETLHFDPMYEHLDIDRSDWKEFVHRRLKDIDKGVSLAFLLPLLLVLAATK